MASARAQERADAPADIRQELGIVLDAVADDPRHVVVRVKGQLHQLDVGLHELRVTQFAQLPGMTKPGGDTRLCLRCQLRILQAFVQISPTLPYERMQPAELPRCSGVPRLSSGWTNDPSE